MQQIWYRMLGDTQTQSSDKYKEILDIKGKRKKKEVKEKKILLSQVLRRKSLFCMSSHIYKQASSYVLYQKPQPLFSLLQYPVRP